MGQPDQSEWEWDAVMGYAASRIRNQESGIRNQESGIKVKSELHAPLFDEHGPAQVERLRQRQLGGLWPAQTAKTGRREDV
ncbi:hypothetical protein CHU98_g3838 [Xylaria longipes]|nr:hypothetical protein CHU98_g3838 [Xylaria longipes]